MKLICEELRMKRKNITDELRAALLRESPAFAGLSEQETIQIVKMSGGKDGLYEKGKYILRQGDRIFGFGIILEGMIQSSRLEGNSRVIFRNYQKGELVADDLVFGGVAASVCDFTAVEDTWVVWIEIPHSMEVLARRCVNHNKLLHNLIRIMALRNLTLIERTQVLTRKTLRGKLLCYLEQEAVRQGKKSFTVPFTRDELADYLGADRSALSRTISALKKEGLIECRGKYFSLCPKEK